MVKQYRLPKEFAVRWTAALRSGDYKQGKGWLMRSLPADAGNTYCCLGVAGATCNVPERLLRQFGRLSLSMEPAKFGIPEELSGGTALAHACVSMNDKDRKTFSEIADWLDENVEYYE